MVSKNEIRVGVKFDVDNKQLDVSKQKINDLLSNLQKIQTDFQSAKILGEADKDFEKAAQEAKKLEQILKDSWNSKLGQLDLSKFNNSLKQSYGTVGGLRNQLKGAGTDGIAAFNNIASSILNTNLELKKSSVLLDKMALTMANTVRFGISSSIFNSMTGSISKAYNYSKDLDRSLNDIRIVSGQSADQMERFAKYANTAAKELGASTLDYTNASLIYYQQGLTGSEVTERTDVTVKMANALGASAEEVSQYMTAIWNNFDNGSESLEHYADVLTALGASTASSSEEIAQGLEKFAAVSNTVGLSYDYATSALATVVAETRQSADTVGTAFKTLFARIQSLNLGETLDDGTTLGKYSKALESVGINIKDQNGQLKQMDTILDEMGAKWVTLNSDQKVALAQNVAGIRQYTQLVALMDNWDKFQKNLATVSNSAGTLQKQQDIYMDSVEAHLQRLKTEAENTYDILFDTKTVNNFADSLTSVTKIFNNLIAGVGGGASAFTYLGSTVANVFSNQIGNAISRQIQNLEIARKNAEGFELKNQIANMYTAQGEIGIDPNSARIQKEAEIYKQIYAIKDNITQEEYNQLTALQKKMGIDEERLTYLKQYKEIGLDLLNNENASVKDYEEMLGYAQEDVELEKQKLSFLTREKNLYQGGIREEEETEDFRQALSDLGQQRTTSLEQFKVIEDARMKIIDEEKLSEKEIQTILEAQNQVIQERQQTESSIIQGLEGRRAAEEGIIDNLEREQTARQNIINQVKQQAEYQKNIQTAVRGLTAIISLTTSLSGIVKTLNDDTLSAGEKAERAITTVLAMTPVLIANFSSIIKFFPAINAALPKLVVNLKLMSAAEVEAGVSAKAMWAAILGPIAVIALGIASVVGAVNTLVGALNKEADAAESAAKSAQELSQTYETVKEKATELKNTISDYTDALTELQKLTKGTDDYADALNTANEKAKELMKTHNLYDKAYYESGLIKFQEGTLEALQSQTNVQTQMAALGMYNAKIYANNASLKAQTTSTNRSTGFVRTWIEDDLSITDEQIKTIINDLQKLELENAVQYTQIKNSNEAFAQWIQSTYSSDKELQLLSEQIGKNRDSFIELLNATDRITKANDQYYDEINKIAIEGKYGEEIAKLATDSSGNFSQGLYEQILSIFNKSDIQEAIKTTEKAATEKLQLETSNLSGDRYVSEEAWSHEFEQAFGSIFGAQGNLNTLVSNQLKTKGVSTDYLEDLLGRSNLESNRDLAEAYAKLTGININTATWKGDQFVGDTGETVLDASSTEARAKMRARIYTDVLTKFNNERIQNEEEAESQSYLRILKTAKENATKAGQEYGTDFSMALLNALSNETNQFDLSNIYAALNPEEVEKLQNKSTEELLNMFGLTEDELQTLGFESAEQFASSFQSGLENYEWDPAAAIGNVLSGRDKELEDLGLDVDELADYSEYLMEIANGAEDAQDSLNDLANEMNHNADSAVIVAKSVMRMNNGIEKLTDGQEDWLDILKKSGMESEEYYDALTGLRDAIGDLLDLTEDTEKYLDGDFFTKNADLIAKAAEGDADAIDKLRDATTDSIIVKIALDNELDDSTIASLQDSVNYLQSLAEPIVVGTELNLEGLDEGSQEFLQACQDIISNAHMTAEQANAFFESMGFQTNFVTEEKPMDQVVPRTITVTDIIEQDKDENGNVTHQKVATSSYQDGTDTFTGMQTVMAMATSADGSKFPIINSMTKKGTGKSNNYSKKNIGGGSSGKKSSGGGSAKEPDKMDPLEEEADRYHQVNTQITKVENALKKLTSQEEKFVGAKLIDNLNKQWALLNTQVDNYNEKLRIARDEQEELRQSLAAQGTEFNADGTISNYMEVFAAKQNYVNSLIDRYNSMSAEEQESYKDTVEKAKEDFKEFQKDLDRYDTLVSNEIPNLSQSIQDALDKQIELNIKKFNMEVTLTLDMAEAERDWNKWKAKVLDGIKESDILGNAQARLQDFSSYYDSAAAGSIQVQSRHLEDTLDELRKMDNGIDNVYGDNRTQALEDLQTYYKQLMEDLEGVLDLQTEIHQAYLDMMDEAQDKFSEQLETYSMIGDLLNNNMKVVQLIYGEDAYGQLSNYYQQQYDNNMAQLDFLRQQKQLWADQMELFEEGSEEWQSAKEKWMDAANELSSTLTDALDTARESFENTIKEIFQDLNNLVTDNLGLDYVNEEWELINRNADRYLDSVNAIAGIRSLESKYLDSINDAINPKNQQRLNALMNSELTTLKSMDKLSQADLDRAELKYQIALAQIALEDAQQQKSQMRLRRDTQGNYTYQYTADEDAINKARENLNKLYVDLYNFDKEQYRTNLDDIYKTWEEYQQKMAEAALINDPELRAQRELLIQQEYNELLNGMLEQNTAFRLNLEQSSYMSLNQMYQDDLMNFTTYTQAERDTLLNELGGAFNSLLEVYGINVEAFKEMTIQEQNDIIENLGTAFTTLSGFYNEDVEKFNQLAEDHQVILVEKMVPQWESAIQAMADKISGEGGLAQTTEDAMNRIKDATAEYDKQVELLANTAEKTTTEIGKGLDNDINKTQQLVKDNTQLIDAYDNELKAVKNVCDQIDELIKKYGTAETAAKKATEAAYKYWLQEQQKNASAAKTQTNTTSNANSSNVNANIGANAANVASTGAAASSQGNGNIDLGDKVTLNGKISSSSYNNPGLTPISKYRGAQLYVQMINEGKPSPYHLGTSPNYSSSTAVGWTNKDQISGYDTGGYTGTWNNNGRLAFLHQKELVLNANDTANMLNAVTIMRNLANNLGENILAKLAGVTAGKGSTVGGDGSLEQNVHIEATFPGVKDAKEIEDALNNLVNSASQRAFEKR